MSNTDKPAIYEIANPSDAVTITGRQALPILALAGSDTAEKWMAENINIQEILDERMPELIACLRSALYTAKETTREVVEKAYGEDWQAIAEWNDKRRTSRNNICGYAFELADMYEKRLSEAAEAASAEQPT